MTATHVPTSDTPLAPAPKGTGGRTIDIVPHRSERSPSRAATRRRWTTIGLGLLPPVLLLLLWQLGTSNGAVDTRFFPAPSFIAEEGWSLIRSGDLGTDVYATLRMVGIGFGVGASTGIVVGLVMGTIPAVGSLLRPSVTAAYTVPKLGVFPLLLLIFGLGDTPKLVLVGATVFLLVALATADASAGVPDPMKDVGRAFGAPYHRKLVEIVLPSAMPGIFTSLRLSMGISLLIVIATEFVNGREGIGYLIWNSWNLFQPAPMYVGVIASAVVGVIITSLVGVVERLCTPWAMGSRERAVV